MSEIKFAVNNQEGSETATQEGDPKKFESRLLPFDECARKLGGVISLEKTPFSVEPIRLAHEKLFLDVSHILQGSNCVWEQVFGSISSALEIFWRDTGIYTEVWQVFAPFLSHDFKEGMLRFFVDTKIITGSAEPLEKRLRELVWRIVEYKEIVGYKDLLRVREKA